MAAIITSKFRVFNAKKFIDALSASNYYYMFIGRPESWADDLVPPNPADNVKQDNKIWDSMIAMKRITANDVSHGIYRRTWTAGKYYDMYRHDYDGTVPGVDIDTGSSTYPLSLSDANYYVVTANNSVYVCLKRNGQSTVSPQTLGTGGAQFLPVTGADGYVWKYIGTTDSTAVNKFQSTYYHPVRTLTTAPLTGDPYEVQWNAQQTAKTTYPGAIFNVLVTGQGTGYVQGTPPSVTVEGDGANATAVAVVDGTGKVVGINMTNYGTGYTWANIVIAAPSAGTTATATAIITPKDGLGADPVRDLNGYFVIAYSAFVEAEGAGDFPVTNDYRQIGLVANPIENGGTTLLTLPTASSCYAIKLNPYSGSFSPDSIITEQDGAKGRIIDTYVSGPDLVVRYIRTESEQVGAGASSSFNVGKTVSTSALGTGTITEVLDKTNGGPEVEKYTGQVIYYENRRAIQRSADQTEVIIITFEF
jgi:hypothetical protein